MPTIKKEPNMLQPNELVGQRRFKLEHAIRALLVVNQQYVLVGTD
jgi:hypothetical protein